MSASFPPSSTGRLGGGRLRDVLLRGREKPGETSPSSCPREFGPFLPVKTLQACRPALLEEDGGRLFFTRPSALTTAPKCPLRGPGRFPISFPQQRRGNLGVLPCPPSATTASYQPSSLTIAPGSPRPGLSPSCRAGSADAAITWRLGGASWGGAYWDRGGSESPSLELLERNTGSLCQSPEPFPGKDQHQPPG